MGHLHPGPEDNEPGRQFRKTHVKLALVVRGKAHGIGRYIPVGTGNYHTGTARLYEDLGLLAADPELAAKAVALFNELTGGIPSPTQGRLPVAPHDMRVRFAALIRREAEHARARPPAARTPDLPVGRGASGPGRSRHQRLDPTLPWLVR